VRFEPTKRLVVWTCMASWGLAACGGQKLIDLGGDAAQGATDSGADDAGGDAFAPQNPIGVFPCGPSVCSSPDVCCLQYAAVEQCTTLAQCSGLALGCDAVSCPAGALCCVSAAWVDPDAGQFGGSSRCVQGTTCPDGAQQACRDWKDCPRSYECSGLVFASGCTWFDAGSVD
jgi:hypothetical protein